MPNLLTELGHIYHSSLLAIWLMLVTVLLQAIIAMVAHRRQKRYVPGILDPALSHESFVFRSHRTFQNSQENLPVMLFSMLLAILAGFDASALALLSWVYALARVIHMALYYAIATEKNPSPRSYAYSLALFCNIVLLGWLGSLLITA